VGLKWDGNSKRQGIKTSPNAVVVVNISSLTMRRKNIFVRLIKNTSAYLCTLEVNVKNTRRDINGMD